MAALLVSGPSWAAVEDITSIIARAPILNPNSSPYPDSSLVDRSTRLDAPAGKRGFVTSRDGHFYFADGTRARFFGINLAKDTVFVDKGQIDKMVDLFARSGINLVRIHHIDDTNGILDPAHPGQFRADKLDLVDYWIARLRERGIYLCLDLNDYRTFTAAEGVVGGEKLGRGAKPYAVFDQRLMELQQEYARRLLVDHINPYTQLAYANDPAIALLEIYDENGLFIRRDDWPTLREPYRTALQQYWNAWLRYRYGTTASLKLAWTSRDHGSALTAKESLEQATVKLPIMTLEREQALHSDPLQAPARVNDGVLFAYEVQMNYLQMMRDYLREIGFQAPVTAVGAQDVLPDLMATAATTDYIGINYYFDHPSWNAGREWTMPTYFSLNNPLDGDNSNYTFPAVVSQARMQGKPLVVRELGYCFPNPYRGAGTLEAAAYGAFLDVDALILFTYGASSVMNAIDYFDIHLDPLRWGVVSQASTLFLSGAVTPARQTIGIGYSEVDAFTWQIYQSSLYQLSFSTQVVNVTDPSKPNPFDLLVTSGRSCGTAWSGERMVLFANERHTDIHYRRYAEGLDALMGYKLQTGRSGSLNLTFHGVGYDAGVTKALQASPSYVFSDLRAKQLQPVAVDGGLAYGFIDPKRKIIGFRNLPEFLAQRVALDALRDWSQAAVSHADLDENRWRTDTGQLERNLSTELLRIDTPTMQALVGALDGQSALRTSGFLLSSPTPIGTFVAESLDGTPVASSQHISVKMTSRAVNDNTVVVAADDGPKPFKFVARGGPPIRTGGVRSSVPTRVIRNGALLIELGLRDGTWEYLLQPGRALLYLDTGNITVTVPTRPQLVRMYSTRNPIELTPDENSFTVPEGVKFVEILW